MRSVARSSGTKSRDVRRLNGHKDGEGEGGQHTKDESDGVESSGGLGAEASPEE
jgi:hypothetical protein